MSVDSCARSPPTSAAVGVSEAGAVPPIGIVGEVSATWKSTPIACCGESGASVMNTAFQSPAAGNSTLAT